MSGGAGGARVTLTSDSEPPQDFELADDGSLADTSIVTGSFELSVAKRGFDSFLQPVTVTPGDAQEIQVSMPELPGTLSINTDPNGATVSIDGAEIGETPIEDHELPAGAHVESAASFAHWRPLDCTLTR